MSKARELADLGSVTTRLDEVGNTDGALSNRNLIINGNFTVSQRGDYSSATALTGTSTYLVDRWKFYDSVVSGTATHSTRMMRLDATSSGTGQVRGDQYVETQNILPDQTYILSAYVKSNKNGAGLAVFDDETSGAGDTDVYTALHTGSGAWELLTVSFTTRAAEPYQFFVRFALTPTGNGAITSGEYLEVKEVQLEVGDTATPFEHRSYGDELARCQRYCVVYENGTALAGNAANTTVFQSRFQYPVVMRAKPSASIVSGTDYRISDDFASDHVAATLGIGSISTSDLGCRLALTGFSGLTTGRTYAGVYSTAQDAKIMFDAEL